MRFLIGFIATAFVAAPALALDVSIGDPGFYGRINLAGAPAPQLVYAKPVLVKQPQEATAPIYMRVPPGHARNWKKHCGSYGACGQPVYFVQNGWYNNVYAPHYRKQHGKGGGNKGGGKAHNNKD